MSNHARQIQQLYERLQKNEYFGKSRPPIDYEFVALMVKTYGLNELRMELNKMLLWLKANPNRTKKNYRKFIVNWMNRRQSNLHIHISPREDEE